MDIMKKVDEVVEKIKKDKNLAEKFQKDPVKAIESVIGVDLPDDQVKNLVKAVKAKVDIDKVGDALGGLGKMLGKK